MSENPDNKQAALSSIEHKYTDYFAAKTNYVDIHGLFARMVGKKELNEIIKLKNGYLFMKKSMNEVQIERISENMIDFQDYLSLNDIPLVQVLCPNTLLNDNDPVIPSGYTITMNQQADEFKNRLIDNDIKVLDLREEYIADGLPPYEFYYKTEPHWTIDTAFWAHTKIATLIDETLGNPYANQDYFDLENYTITTYENNTLGSCGVRVGIWFAGTSDVNIIMPNFETSLTTQVPTSSLIKTGQFSEVCTNEHALASNHLTPFTNNGYGYFEFYTEYVTFTNHLVENDKKIFVLRDSFSVALVQYLALHYKEVYVYDLRYNIDGKEIMLQLINDIQPDIVLNISAVEVLSDLKQFEFLTPLALDKVKNIDKTQ